MKKIFFSITDQKVIKTDLWLIYSKIFEFMANAFIFAFSETIFFLRPSKASVEGQELYNFGFLTFNIPSKSKKLKKKKYFFQP